jgi:hypothetical protein
LLQIPHARNLEKEFPAANTPIPCPVTMQVDRKNQALTVRCPHCRAQFKLPNQQTCFTASPCEQQCTCTWVRRSG